MLKYQHKYFYLIKDTESEFVLTPDTLNTYKETKLEWEIKEPVVSQKWIYAEEFKISVLNIVISFKTRAQQAKNQLLGFGVIFKSLGVALANVDEANINIKGMKFEHVFETNDSLKNKLIQHYKDNGIKQGLKIIGSIDIIGNPVNLFSNIGTGVVDFFEKPIEGFATGPLDVAKGVGKGTASLVKNTSKGIFNSASKATGAMASGLSALTMDDKFIQNREQMRLEKSKNVFTGIGKGAKSLGIGVFQGVTGIFTQPLKGAREGGFIGFLKGTAKGIVGVVTKPLSGALDLASHTTEGFKNTVTYFDDKANEIKQRKPRAFYGREKFFKKYLKFEAELLNNLKVFENGKFAFDSFMWSFPLSEDLKNQVLIIVTFEHIIYYNESKNKIIFVIEPGDITKINLDEKGLKFVVNDNSEMKEFDVVNNNEELLKEITREINEIRYITLDN